MQILLPILNTEFKPYSTHIDLLLKVNVMLTALKKYQSDSQSTFSISHKDISHNPNKIGTATRLSPKFIFRNHRNSPYFLPAPPLILLSLYTSVLIWHSHPDTPKPATTARPPPLDIYQSNVIAQQVFVTIIRYREVSRKTSYYVPILNTKQSLAAT